jgi:hypothetical protein
MAGLAGIGAPIRRSIGRVGLWALVLTGPLLGPPFASAVTVRIKDLDYIHRTYFFIADHPIEWDRASLLVFRDDADPTNNAGATILGRARLDPLAPADAIQNPEYVGYFNYLTEGQDYDLVFPYIVASGPAMIPVIRLAAPLPPQAILAVSYIERVGEDTIPVGNPNPSFADSALGKGIGEVLLKMINVPLVSFPTVPGGAFDPASPWYRALSYELRNLYRLGIQNFAREDLTVRVRHLDAAFATDPDNDHGIPFISLLGLDQIGPTVNSPPDGKVDPQYIDSENGILLFPDLHPFDPDTTVGSCPPGTAGFLCLDDIGRNSLRVCDDFNACIANPAVYHTKYPDPLSQTRFYLEVSLPEPPAPEVLRQNRPNPFRAGTTIEFITEEVGLVRLTVHDIHGRLVRELARGTLSAGPHAFTWDGTNAAGRRVAAGVYVCRLAGDGFTSSRRMVLMR